MQRYIKIINDVIALNNYLICSISLLFSMYPHMIISLILGNQFFNTGKTAIFKTLIV